MTAPEDECLACMLTRERRPYLSKDCYFPFYGTRTAFTETNRSKQLWSVIHLDRMQEARGPHSRAATTMLRVKEAAWGRETSGQHAGGLGDLAASSQTIVPRQQPTWGRTHRVFPPPHSWKDVWHDQQICLLHLLTLWRTFNKNALSMEESDTASQKLCPNVPASVFRIHTILLGSDHSQLLETFFFFLFGDFIRGCLGDFIRGSWT